MIKTIINSFNEYQLDLKDQKVVIGVSTGVDSMTLLDALEKAQLGCEVIVCHVNHGKREESDTEEAFIREYCLIHQFKLYVLNLKDQVFSKNFQEEARQLRYQFFYQTMDQENCHILLLAHHLNDDLETMFMRIIRGSNLKGYAGIEQYQEVNNKIIFRPFLKVLKEEIIKFANDNNIKYFDDYTNFTDLYTRNRIRQHIIPELFKESSDVHLKLLEFKETLNEVNNIINERRNEYREKLIIPLENGIRFNREAFLAVNYYLQQEILFEELKQYFLSKKNIEEIIKFIKSDKKNLNIHYKNFTFVKEYNDIYLYFSNIVKKSVFVEINDVGVYPINEKYSINVMKKSAKYFPNLDKVWYNSSKFPVIIRSRKDGDKIRLSYGTKKIKKLLIDNKVGISKRNEVLVLEKDESILAVFGYVKGEDLPKIDNCDIIIEIKENNNGN